MFIICLLYILCDHCPVMSVGVCLSVEHVQNFPTYTVDKSYTVFIRYIVNLCIPYTFCMEFVCYVSCTCSLISGDVC